ncbi:SRPBCC domain-containing protein [Microbispora corallina]|uniref:Activator of HSP90 ATPase n=1 Tax=Microbispora corallina TaxID=83302 RepID=A0ABQ4FTI0_9ACTN|nr:SRPBCC domain-containing protein [Microbispora corallina]GIH38130.1 activator of HSP90 ATPase [Microbispora corallina]
MAAPDREYTITVVLDAPRETVFRAWTDPESFTQWFGPRGFTTPLPTTSLDVRPGGAWSAVLVSPDGAKAPLGGVYHEVAAPERLVFTTGDPDNTEGAPASVAAVTLDDLGDGRTEMRFHQAGYNTDEAHAEAAKAGWLQFFDRLAEHVAAS